ncbi:MAG: PF20097 family protein [Acutalibacteraceae bacterium]|nr:PF20097 family protein [Acutalibacteraceae bacterium]
MNCPYCSKEMRLGYFHDYEVPIKWIPADKKFSLLNFTVVGGAVPLSSEKYSWVKGFVSQAYYCENCHTVIAKTEMQTGENG